MENTLRKAIEDLVGTIQDGAKKGPGAVEPTFSLFPRPLQVLIVNSDDDDDDGDMPGLSVNNDADDNENERERERDEKASVPTIRQSGANQGLLDGLKELLNLEDKPASPRARDAPSPTDDSYVFPTRSHSSLVVYVVGDDSSVNKVLTAGLAVQRRCQGLLDLTVVPLPTKGDSAHNLMVSEWYAHVSLAYNSLLLPLFGLSHLLCLPSPVPFARFVSNRIRSTSLLKRQEPELFPDNLDNSGKVCLSGGHIPALLRHSISLHSSLCRSSVSMPHLTLIGTSSDGSKCQMVVAACLEIGVAADKVLARKTIPV
ncbi:hypothetical protein KIPB_008956 [Kipferlia bialata]|uniref:Uncharacterized protein n=1 Tax=Kipferlia bialata TaxID=797122 RepID=A0A9K3D0T1_9EUKA|nr:hypothetical protein KIPB_008956 [Kipferlia bialata]|eukprot:g8956.t1